MMKMADIGTYHDTNGTLSAMKVEIFTFIALIAYQVNFEKSCLQTTYHKNLMCYYLNNSLIVSN